MTCLAWGIGSIWSCRSGIGFPVAAYLTLLMLLVLRGPAPHTLLQAVAFSVSLLAQTPSPPVGTDTIVWPVPLHGGLVVGA
jgi:hypothetical protein